MALAAECGNMNDLALMPTIASFTFLALVDDVEAEQMRIAHMRLCLMRWWSAFMWLVRFCSHPKMTLHKLQIHFEHMKFQTRLTDFTN